MPGRPMPARPDRLRTPFPRLLPRLLPGALLLLLAVTFARAADEPATERWYENLEQGKKLGHLHVVWSPSTWKGKKTVHDTTVGVIRHTRNMGGMMDTFETTSTSDLERDDDGTLWWMKVVSHEADRVTTMELTWTGTSYEHVVALDGQVQKTVVPLSEPVMTDAEAFLGSKARAGTLKAGDKWSLRSLDVRAKKAHVDELEVLGPDEAEGEAGKVACTKVVQRDPEAKTEMWLWIDVSGAFVVIKDDGGSVTRRVQREKAEAAPARPTEFSITSPSVPPLERIFSADRTLVDVHLSGDADRKPPEFPDSPWSRVTSVEGGGADGCVMKAELTAYDHPEAGGTLPVDEKAFEKDLEPTPLMPCRHPKLVATAEQVIGGEKDLRKAAWLLSRFVYSSLTKESPDVAQASALQILKEQKGDCSEHALLFVALCRAAGIPARRCTGWVCIGSLWGAHAWAEIWTGKWIGADPTTGEVGSGARYLFFGYSDDPTSHPDVVSSRITGRIRLVTTRVEEGDDAYDLTDESTWTIQDRRSGRYVQVLAGIEARDVPPTWAVTVDANGPVKFRAEGLKASLHAEADQGRLLEEGAGSGLTTFAGAPAVITKSGNRRRITAQSRRRIIRLTIDEGTDEQVRTLERILAPTFAPRPVAPPPPAEGAAPAEPPAKEPPPPAVTKESVRGKYVFDAADLKEQIEDLILSSLPDDMTDERRTEILASALGGIGDLEGHVTLAADGTYFFRLAIATPEGGEPPSGIARRVCDAVLGAGADAIGHSGAWNLEGSTLVLDTAKRGDEAVSPPERSEAHLRDGSMTFTVDLGLHITFRRAAYEPKPH